MYRELELLKLQQTFFGWVIAAAILAIIVLSVWEPLDVGVGGLAGGETDTDWSDLAFVALFGVLGAAVSGTRPSADRETARLPALIAAWQMVAVRPLIGAAAALAAYAFLASGSVESGSAGLVLGAAFAAGVSERLVLRGVESLIRPAGA